MNTSKQKRAMELIQSIQQSVTLTDREGVLTALGELYTLDFTKVDYPLSLLSSFCDVFKRGRDDFYQIDLKLLCTTLMKKIAAQTFVTIVKANKYVVSATKKEALAKLDMLKKLLNPYKEPCADIVQHIRYIRAVIELLPEKSSAIYAQTRLLYNVFQVVWNQDTDALEELVQTIYDKGKELYEDSMVEQIACIELLSIRILQHGDPKAFAKLLDIHQHTKMVEVQAETTNVLIGIASAYYGPQGAEGSVTSSQGYEAFTSILEVSKKSRFLGLNDWWMIQCIAVKGLIGLRGRFETQDKNTAKIIETYLDAIQKHETQSKQKGFQQLAAKMRLQPKNTQLEAVFNHQNQVYLLLNATEMLKRYVGKQQTDPRFAQLNDKLDRILDKLNHMSNQ